MNTWQNLLGELIGFKTANGLIMTKYQEIIYCSADGSYSNIYSSSHPEIIVSSNLAFLEKTLPNQLFVRVHHKFLVNKLHVRKLLTNGTSYIILSNGAKLEISSRKKKEVVQRFKEYLE